jgi:hypothetical protein
MKLMRRCRPGLCDETSRKESVRAGQRGGEERGDEEVGRERNAMVVGTRQAGWRATMACSRSDDDTKGAAGGGSSAKSTKEASKGSNKQKSSGRKTGSTGLSLDRSLSGLQARVCSRAKRSTTICLEQSRQGAGGAAALSRHANGASPPSSPLMRRLVRNTHTQQSPVSQSEPKGRRSRGRREGEPPLEARHQCRPHRALVSPLGRLRRGRIGSRASRSSGTLAVSNPSVRKGSTTHI